jgi:hypothetical protein
MKRILASAVPLCAYSVVCNSAFAEVISNPESVKPDITSQIVYWAITIIGLFVARTISLSGVWTPSRSWNRY